MSTTPVKTVTPVAAHTLIAAMERAPHSLDDLVAVSGLAKPTVTRFVKGLTEAKLARVGDWARDRRGYPTIRKFAMGSEPDADCPVLYKSNAERIRAVRAARKAAAK